VPAAGSLAGEGILGLPQPSPSAPAEAALGRRRRRGRVVTFFILTFQGNRGERVYIFFILFVQYLTITLLRAGGRGGVFSALAEKQRVPFDSSTTTCARNTDKYKE